MKNIFKRTIITIIALITLSTCCFAENEITYDYFQSYKDLNRTITLYVTDWNEIYVPIRAFVDGLIQNQTDNHYALDYDPVNDVVILTLFDHSHGTLKAGSSLVDWDYEGTYPEQTQGLNFPIIERNGTTYCHITDLEGLFNQTFYIDNYINAIHFFGAFGREQQYFITQEIEPGNYRIIDSAFAAKYMSNFNKK